MMNPIDPVQFDINPPVTPSGDRKPAALDSSKPSKTDRSVRLELRTDYHPFVQKALRSLQTSDSAVLEAKKALEQGEIDSPQAARAAAQAILRFGI
ncbi:MAG: hypothetical protein WHS88_11380 [Anaerohalosphaeraceae bacterium]